MIFVEGILPQNVTDVINKPPVRVSRVPQDNRTAKFEAMAQAQNHSSRDRGNQLKVNPTSRSRHGNQR